MKHEIDSWHGGRQQESPRARVDYLGGVKGPRYQEKNMWEMFLRGMSLAARMTLWPTLYFGPKSAYDPTKSDEVLSRWNFYLLFQGREQGWLVTQAALERRQTRG